MASEEMLRKLLDEFVEREALINEELGVIQDQIQQLEERLTGCQGRLSTIGSDREKILSIRMRYEDGQFLSDMNFGEATNPQIYTNVSAPTPYVHAPNIPGHTPQPLSAAASAINGSAHTQTPAFNGVEQSVAPAAGATSHPAADLPPLPQPENHSTAHPEPAAESTPAAASPFKSIADYLNNVVTEPSSPASVPSSSAASNPASTNSAAIDPFKYPTSTEASSGSDPNARAATDNFSQYMSESMFDESSSEAPEGAPLPASAVVPPVVSNQVSESGTIGSGRPEIRLSSTPNSALPGINALLSRNASAVPPVPSNAQSVSTTASAANSSDGVTTQPESGAGTDSAATNAPAATEANPAEDKPSVIDLGATENDGEDPDGGETVKSINDALRSLFR